MNNFTLAIIGRTNVGKSSLFNLLAGRNLALVADIEGLTRDRQYAYVPLDPDEQIGFTLIDTAGLFAENKELEDLQKNIDTQIEVAIEEASAIVLVVDGSLGIHPLDKQIATKLKKSNKSVRLLINKIDNPSVNLYANEFLALGLGEGYSLSCKSKRGINELKQEIFEQWSEEYSFMNSNESANSKTMTNIAIVGRPNAGKSTFINALLNEQRVIVSDISGTTIDSIPIEFEYKSEQYCFVDTAGVRRKAKTKEYLDKIASLRSLSSINKSQIVVLMIDVLAGIVSQDLQLIDYSMRLNKSIVIICNKWDLLNPKEQKVFQNSLYKITKFLKNAKILYISALKGFEQDQLFKLIKKIKKSRELEVSINQLTATLQRLCENQKPNSFGGKMSNLKYASQIRTGPPKFLIQGNRVQHLSQDYKRYLVNSFNKLFKLEATSVELEFKNNENPYKEKRNKLTPRQEYKRKRLMKFVKKKK